MPLVRQVEQRRFEQAQLQAASETIGMAAQARKAFFEAVAAQQLVGYFEQVKDAADASNELARRMVAAGNFNKLAQMREESFYLDASTGLARARYQAGASREVLVRVRAAAFNRRDVFITQGLYPGIVLPKTLGSDGAGEIVAFGPGASAATPLAVGDEVVIDPMLDWGRDPRVWDALADLVGPGADVGISSTDELPPAG